jgi:hypothetical protein
VGEGHCVPQAGQCPLTQPIPSLSTDTLRNPLRRLLQLVGVDTSEVGYHSLDRRRHRCRFGWAVPARDQNGGSLGVLLIGGTLPADPGGGGPNYEGNIGASSTLPALSDHQWTRCAAPFTTTPPSLPQSAMLPHCQPI